MDMESETISQSEISADPDGNMEKDLEDPSEIQEFFEGRSVFITGATGYVGGVLMEQLLRLCPGVSEIFILVREKKGCTPEIRKEKLFNKEIFWKLKKENPEAMEKVHVVEGELTVDGLGICSRDLGKLRANVSVVFHCAASVSFKRNFSYMALNNVVGTQNIISLCKKFPKIAAFVYTSTAYSKSYDRVISEEVGQIPFSVQEVTDAARASDAKLLTELERSCGKKWPNAYILSKFLGEILAAEEGADIPTAIVRPSIIAILWKGSLPGHLEFRTTLPGVIKAVALGFVQVVLIDENKNVDITACDIVANTLIAAAYSVAKKRMGSPLVINCVSGDTLSHTSTKMFMKLAENWLYYVGPYTVRTTQVRMVSSTTIYLLLSFLYHHIPGYALDLYFRIKGLKPRAIEGYKKLDRSMLDARFFALNEFSFNTANFKGLRSVLNKTDNMLFYTDFSSCTVEGLLETIPVNKIFHFKNDNDVTLKCRQVEQAVRVEMYTQIYKCFLLFLLVLFVWFFVKLILSVLIP